MTILGSRRSSSGSRTEIPGHRSRSGKQIEECTFALRYVTLPRFSSAPQLAHRPTCHVHVRALPMRTTIRPDAADGGLHCFYW
jgi:hypothetical protein